MLCPWSRLGCPSHEHLTRVQGVQRLFRPTLRRKKRLDSERRPTSLRAARVWLPWSYGSHQRPGHNRGGTNPSSGSVAAAELVLHKVALLPGHCLISFAVWIHTLRFPISFGRPAIISRAAKHSIPHARPEMFILWKRSLLIQKDLSCSVRCDACTTQFCFGSVARISSSVDLPFGECPVALCAALAVLKKLQQLEAQQSGPPYWIRELEQKTAQGRN